MNHTARASLVFSSAALIAFAVRSARAEETTTGDLRRDDFAFTVWLMGGGSTDKQLDERARASFLGRTRCLCPSGLEARLELTETGRMKLGDGKLEIDLEAGNDCDTKADGCRNLAALTLTSSKSQTLQSLGTTDLFRAANGDEAPACDGLTKGVARLWAVVRLDGKLIATHPSLAFTVDPGGAPKAPTAVVAALAEGGLVVSWTAAADAKTIAGHQVLCAPGPAKPSAPAYESCAAAPPPAGTGPFVTPDDAFVCSGLVAASATSVRVAGLENGREYTLAVIAIGLDGSPSAPSAIATGKPGPTLGFFDRYEQDGGEAQPGCAIAGPARGASGGGALALLALLAIAVARGRRRAILAGVAVMLIGQPALAQPAVALDQDSRRANESPRHWNLELRLGPYRPDVDGELASRGSGARPFRDTFSNDRRLMTQLELDRHVLDALGTLAVGLSVGRYRATAPALAPDLVSKTGDETALALVPLAASLVYRADWLERRFDVPFVPFAKLGLDYVLWTAEHSGRSTRQDGATAGWHAAAGVAMYLDFLDPGAARTVDQETGVNHTAIFFEVARYKIDGLGSAKKLRLGDTTWFAGLMLEL